MFTGGHSFDTCKSSVISPTRAGCELCMEVPGIGWLLNWPVSFDSTASEVFPYIEKAGRMKISRGE